MYTTKGMECELVWDYNCSFSLINCSFSGGIMGYMVLFMRAVLILEASMMGICNAHRSKCSGLHWSRGSVLLDLHKRGASSKVTVVSSLGLMKTHKCEHYARVCEDTVWETTCPRA